MRALPHETSIDPIPGFILSDEGRKGGEKTFPLIGEWAGTISSDVAAHGRGMGNSEMEGGALPTRHGRDIDWRWTTRRPGIKVVALQARKESAGPSEAVQFAI